MYNCLKTIFEHWGQKKSFPPKKTDSIPVNITDTQKLWLKLFLLYLNQTHLVPLKPLLILSPPLYCLPSCHISTSRRSINTYSAHNYKHKNCLTFLFFFFLPKTVDQIWKIWEPDKNKAWFVTSQLVWEPNFSVKKKRMIYSYSLEFRNFLPWQLFWRLRYICLWIFLWQKVKLHHSWNLGPSIHPHYLSAWIFLFASDTPENRKRSRGTTPPCHLQIHQISLYKTYVSIL